MSICCIRYVKDTILKAIYNGVSKHDYNNELYSICQRYNFESNLQLVDKCNISYYAVFDMSKIQF